MNTARPVREVIDDHFNWFNDLLEKMKGNSEVFEYLRVKTDNLISRLDREDPSRQQGRQEFHRHLNRDRLQRLSPRELEVACLTANGLLNKEVSSKLGIAIKTVEKHRANAMRKLGIKRTAQLVTMVTLAGMNNEERTGKSN